MQSDFAMMAKSARSALTVPELQIDYIRSRSHAIRRQDRVRAVTMCGAIALAAIGAGAIGAKIAGGVEVWLSGNRAAVVINSLATIKAPSAHDLEAISAKATFPLTYPVGLPANTRVTRIIYAPFDHPNVVVVSYWNPQEHINAGFALVDSRAVNPTDVASLENGSPVAYGDVYRWQTGEEAVVIPKNALAAKYAETVEAAMHAISPTQSLGQNQAMTWNLRLFGDNYRLADSAQRLAEGGVLVDRDYLALVAGLVRSRKPLTLARITYLNKIAYAKGVPDFGHANMDFEREVAVPTGGVRAVAAVMNAAGLAGRSKDCCEIYYTPAANGRYTIWTLPVDQSQPVKKYTVDASTYRVTE